MFLSFVFRSELMKKVINQARRPPTEKYTHPQTSAQDYGWITQPLVGHTQHNRGSFYWENWSKFSQSATKCQSMRLSITCVSLLKEKWNICNLNVIFVARWAGSSHLDNDYSLCITAGVRDSGQHSSRLCDVRMVVVVEGVSVVTQLDAPGTNFIPFIDFAGEESNTCYTLGLAASISTMPMVPTWEMSKT